MNWRLLNKVVASIMTISSLYAVAAFAQQADQTIMDRANGFMDNGAYDQAIAEFTKVIQANPGSVNAYSGRATAYGAKKDYDHAIADYTHILKMDANKARTYYSRAICYFGKNDFDNSWKDVHTAEKLGYRINPDFIDALKQASGRKE